MDEFTEAPAPAEQPPAPEPVNEPQATEAQEKPDSEQQAKPEKPIRSRREALQQAFKSLADDAEPEKAPKAEKPDVKAEDKSAKEAGASGPERGPDGKFKAKEDTPTPEEKTSLTAPPARFSADAKAAWEAAPESIRAETHRAIREMEQGLAQKDAQLAPLKPYFDLAEQSGTTVDEALKRYVNMETMLRRDPQRGLSELASNLGMTRQQLGQALLGQTPGQPDYRDQTIMDLQREVAELKGGFGTVRQTIQQQQEAAVAQQLDQFAAQHPRFEELSESIAEMLETGFAKDLADAYEKADRLNPAPPAAPEPYTPAPAQTRQAKSVTGAPSAGSNPAQRRPSANRKEALQNAFARAGLA